MNRSNRISPPALALALGLAAIALFTSQPTLGQTTPSVASATVPNGNYGLGEIMPLIVTFSQAVAVSGIPEIQIDTNSPVNHPADYGSASYSAGTGTATLTFEYMVRPNINVTEIALLNQSILLPSGATITRTNGGVNANLILPSRVLTTQATIDSILPAFANPTATATAAIGTAVGTPVYDANATDGGGDADAGITYALTTGDLRGGRTNDHLLFTITRETGLVSYNISPTVEATHTIEIRAEDSAGNIATQIVTVHILSRVSTTQATIDSILPAFANPTARATAAIGTATDTAVYDANATDGGGNADVGITYALTTDDLGGGRTNDHLLFTITRETGLVSYNISPTVEATHTIEIRAEDSDGNIATQIVTIIVLDGPTVFITDNVNVDDGAPDITNLEEVTFTFEWNYAVTDFDLSDITVSGGTADTLTGSGTTYTLTAAIPTTPTNGGVLTVTVVADAVTANSVGNAETTATQHYDTQEPKFTAADAVEVLVSLDTSEGAVVYDANATDGGDNGADDEGILRYEFFEGNENGQFEGGLYDGEYNDFFTEFEISDEGIVTLYATPTEDSVVTYVTQIIAYDAAGNTARQYVAFEFHNAPAVTITDNIFNDDDPDNIEDRVAGIADGDVTFTFVWSQTVTGFDVDDVTVDGGASIANSFTSSGTTYTLTVTPEAATNAGTITVTVKADALTTSGPNNFVTSATQRYDTQPPGVPTIDDLIAGDDINAAEQADGVAVSGTISDTDTVTLCFSPGTTAATEATCGGIGTAYTIDPGTTTWGYTFSMTQIDTIIAAGDQGPYTLTVIAEDAAGNSTASVGKALTVDTIAPAFISGDSANANTTATATAFVGADSSVVVYNADAVDNGAADDGITYRLSGGADAALFTIVPETGVVTYLASPSAVATHIIEITAEDQVGNTATQTVTIMLSMPRAFVTITDSEPEEYANGAVTFTFTLSESVTGFTTGDITVSGGDAGTFTDSGTTYTLTVTPEAATNAGTISVRVAETWSPNPDVVLQRYDTVAPDFSSGTAVATATVGADPSVVVYDAEATDADGVPADAGITYRLSGGANVGLFDILPENGVVTYKDSPTATATHTIEITATDKGGNTAMQTVTITVSDIPTVTITDNVAGEYANGEVTFKFEWNVVVTGFESDDITVDGGEKGTFATANSKVYTLTVTPPTTPTTDGELTVTVTGNVLTTTTGSVNTFTVTSAPATQKYDTVAPVFTSGAANTYEVTVGMATTFVVYDAETNDDGTFTSRKDADDHITYRLTGGANFGLFKINEANGEVTYRARPPVVVSHEIEITATDRGGNTATQTVTITVSERLAGVANDPTDLALLGPTGTSLMGTTVTLDEGSNTYTYTVALTYQPTSDVDVRIDSDNPDVTLDWSLLRFTMDNWQTPQSITITAAEDADADNDSATLTHTASGGGYDGVIANVDVTVTDNFTAGLNLSETNEMGMTVTLVEGNTHTYTVALSYEPTSDVDVRIHSNNADVTPSRSSLRFTMDNWETPQSVTITAAEDADTRNDSATLTHTASGGGYDGVIANVAVTVTEAGLTLLGTDGTMLGTTVTFDEGGTYTYTVKLVADPSETVTVDIASKINRNGADLTMSEVMLSPSSLTFTSNMAQTVTIIANQDSDGIDDLFILTHTARGNGYDALSDVELRVTIRDDDTDTAPTVEITHDVNGEYANGDVTFTFTWSVLVTDFEAEDITVIGGTPGTFTETVRGMVYTLVVTPSAGVLEVTVNPRVARAQGALNEPGIYNASTPTVKVMVRDTARLNEQILTRATQAITTGTIAALGARMEAAAGRFGGGDSGEAGYLGETPRMAYRFGGQSSLRGLLQAHGKAMLQGEMDHAQLLDGASFVMPLSAAGDQSAGNPFGSLSMWGGIDYRNLESDEDGLDWDGEASSVHFGIDGLVSKEVLAGVALSWHRADFAYDSDDGAAGSGEYQYHNANIHPYLGWLPSENVRLWASAGFGNGEVMIEDGSDAKPSTNTAQTSFAGGFSAQLLRTDSLLGGTATLRVKGDVALSKVELERAEGFVQQEVDSHRTRLLLSGEQPRKLVNGGAMTPSLEIGGRSDGGDGITGSGVELGGGLRYANPGGRLIVSGNVRTLLAHDYDEWGADLNVQLLAPSGRGLSLSMNPVWGKTQSVAERLWDDGANEVVGELGGGDGELQSSLATEVGYGMAATMLGSPGLLTPYAGMTVDDVGIGRLRLGGRFAGGNGLSLDLESAQRNTADDVNHTVLLRGELAF